MKRVVITVASIITIAVFTVIISAWWTVFHTEHAVTWVMAHLQKLQSVHIETQGVSGTFAGPLKVKHFELDHPYVHVAADDIELSISPAALLTQTLRVSTLHIASATVVTKKIDDQHNDKPLRFFIPFIRLQTRELIIDRARFETVDGFVQEATHVQGAATLSLSRIKVENIQLTTANFSATGQVSLWAKRPIPLEAIGTLHMPAPQGEEFSTKITIGGDIQHMTLSADLLTPSQAHFVGELTRNGPWQLTGALQSQQFLLQPWMEKPPLSMRDVELKLQANSEDVRIDGELRVPEWDNKPLLLKARGRYSNHVLALLQASLQPIDTTIVVSAAGRIEFGNGKPQINLGTQWLNFRWPLHVKETEAALLSPDGQASLSGSLPYDVGIRANLMLAHRATAQLSAIGQLQASHLIFDRLDMSLLDGAIHGNVALGFEARDWQGNLTIDKLNPGKLDPQWSGSISGQARGSGTGFEKTSLFTLTVPELRGKLRNESLHAEGSVTHDAKGWRVQALQIQLADAHIDINGKIQDSIDLSWSAVVPALQRLDSRVHGALQTNGAIRGTLQKPQVNAAVTGKQLRFDNWSVDSIDARSQAHLAGDGESTLEIDTRNLHLSDVSLGSPSFSAHLKSQTQPQASAKHRAIKQASNGDNWNIDQFCLTWHARSKSTSNYQFCGAAQFANNGAWQLQANSNDIPLSVFDDETAEGSHLQGHLHAQIQAQARAHQAWIGSAAMQISNAAITYQPLAGEEETVKLGTGDININASVERLIATARLTTPGTTQIDASAQLNRSKQSASKESGSQDAQSWLDAEMHAQLRAHTDDANLLPVIITDIDHSAGTLDIDFSANGSMRAPEFGGTIHFSRGELALYRYNLNMRDLSVNARLADNRLQFDGDGKVGEGELHVDGVFGWESQNPSDNLRGNLRFTGERLAVYDVPEYHVLASPNVNFVINGKRIDINGEVFIPTARLQPTDLRSATQLSPDARLTTAIPKKQTRSVDVFSNVSVRLGDDVKIDTLGLKGSLGGAVTLISQPDERAIGRGELNVSSGEYEAYGQQLEIARGRLLFNATPLDDPGLDIQAARNIDDQRVGVNVRGTLRAPRMSLFSEPSLPQSQIVSYLLTGKPIDDLSSSDKAAVGVASNQLALQGGGVLAAQLGRRLGLQQVDIESHGATDTSLVLGKFLSPRLFVSYGISLTESINTLKLRYTLSDRWKLKTEAGKEQSADVEFRIDR